MFNSGEKVKYCNVLVTVLTCNDDEVLILIDRNCIKWVDKVLLEQVKIA